MRTRPRCELPGAARLPNGRPAVNLRLVQDPVDEPTPTPVPRPRRSRKFVLPDHHHDERVDDRAAEHIEAFFDGTVKPPRRPVKKRPIRVPRPFQLDTRPDWMAAVRREAARHDRYGRSASVLLIEVAGESGDVAVDRLAHRLADAIRAEARETDRAVRIAPLGFRLLMPETGTVAAQTAAERLEQAFRSSVDGTMPAIGLRIEVATVARAGSLEDALDDAERRMAERAAAD